MKKSLYFAAMAAVVLASCAKEPVEIAEQNSTATQFSVVASINDDATKGSIDNTGAFTWAAGDQIGMLVDGTVTALTASSIDGDDATFSSTGTSWGTAAFYPWNASTTIGGGKVTFNLPSSYTWKENAVFTPMIADLTGKENPTNIWFKLAGAGVRVTLKNVPAYATSVALTVNGKNITGSFPLDITKAGTEGIAATDGTSSTVTFNFTAPGTEKDMVFTFPVPVISAGSTIKVEILNGAPVWSKTGTIPALKRGQIVNTPELTVSVPDKTPTVSRVWGLYSTSAKAWNEYYGGTANTDRNVAMDADNIYIAETVAGAAKVWAISRTDNTSVTAVNVEGVITEASVFWPVACPRVIKNTDPSINGGKDVLVVGSMSNSTGDYYLYFYLDGITNKPTPVMLGGYGYRRLGDTFTHWGTLQKGMFFFKDFSTGGVCMSYKIANTAGWDWAKVKADYFNDGTIKKVSAQGNLQTPAQTGAGAYFPYPNDKNNGFFGVRGSVNAYTVNMPSDVWSASGRVDDIVNTQLGGYFLNATSALYIEAGKYRYVVYTRQVSSKAGGVMFLKGNATDSWASIIGARQSGGAASATFAISADSTDVTTENAKSSGNDGFDLATYTVDGVVYVAAVKQNVGLSLFKIVVE